MVKKACCQWLFIWSAQEKDVVALKNDLKAQHKDANIVIISSWGALEVYITAPKDDVVASIVRSFVESFQPQCCLSSSGRIEVDIHDYMRHHGLTLSLAESCTGGAIARQLVSVPGCSEYLLGGVVAYSNALKKTLLGVSSETLEQFGAVSEPVANEMVQGVITRCHSDWGVAVSGIAGPEGEAPQKPVGTVVIAVACRGKKSFLQTLHLSGDRETIIQSTAHLALLELFRMLDSPYGNSG